MAKARSRTTARKMKDRWKAKNWYNILAPASFDNVAVADTLSDNPDSLINRVTGVSLQDLTNDFRKSHIVLYFKIHKIEDNNAHTQFVGHTLTSDYLRRMIRRRRSKVEGVYNVTTKDGAFLRLKPFATTEKRIQNSQKRVIRESMKKTLEDQAKTNTMYEFIKNIIDGKMGSDIYKNCKKLYPVKRIEIYKTEVVSQPTVMIEEKKPKKKEEEKPDEVTKETEKKDEISKKEEKKTKDLKEPKPREEKPEKPEEPGKQEKPKKSKITIKKSPAKKHSAKKTPAKKTITKKPATKKKTPTKKKTAKK